MDEIPFGLIDEYESGKSQFDEVRAFILDEILRNIKSLEFIAHPLGFAMTKIRESSTQSLRLHLWFNNIDYSQVPNFPIHDHVFDFKSLILNGSINNCIYEVEEGLKSNGNIYHTHYVDDTSVITKTNSTVQVQQKSLTTEQMGNVYHFKNKVFHSSAVPKNRTTITFLETANKKNNFPRVVGPIDGDAKYTYKRSKLDSEIVRKLIMKIRKT